ncbi:hypothetical protein [Massilia sp. 9I]|uniref:hypothetical protein n=1 Tax=Massilia sp. 9I TaxID=2653152 RepID=UPI001E502A8A|nr:hypothetical protein [Massilia sp. 9I]
MAGNSRPLAKPVSATAAMPVSAARLCSAWLSRDWRTTPLLLVRWTAASASPWKTMTGTVACGGGGAGADGSGPLRIASMALMWELALPLRAIRT